MSSEEVSLGPRLLESLYTEALVLADEARTYFDGDGREQRLGLDPALQVGFCCESLKVTTRLMHVVAWLMARRSADAAPREEVLVTVPDGDAATLEALPERAQALIAASQDLHARVRRLGPTEESPLASPARSLLSRLERAF